MPWATPSERCHCTPMPAAASAWPAMNIAWNGITSSRSPWTRRTGGLARAFASRCSGPASAPEKATMAPGPRARRNPTCSAIIVPWLKPTRARSRSVSPRRDSSASRKASRSGPARVTPRHISRRIAHGQREPLEARTRPGRSARARAGETKAASGSSALPLPAERDQVVAVRAVAVEQDDELAGGAAGGGRQARAIEVSGHRALLRLVGYWDIPARPRTTA